MIRTLVLLFMNVVNKIKNKNTLMYVMAALSGVALFLYLYGVKVLDPTYTRWLLRGSDLSQHYIGWEAYRMNHWTFPFGCYDLLSYPSKMSVIFSDSIPLMAFFFKLLSPILPVEFQYFGWWGIICFVLQAVVGTHITSKFTPNAFVSFCGGMLFLMSPVMIYRMYYHSALAGQWILLISIDLMVAKLFPDRCTICNVEMADETVARRSEIIAWGIVGLLAAGTHIYLLMMCGIVLIGRCLYSLIKDKSIRNVWKQFLAFLMAAAVVVYLMGGFMPGMGAALSGLGSYSMNINSLINPMGWSFIFKDLTLVSEKQMEGLGYMGLGVYGLTAFGIIILLLGRRRAVQTESASGEKNTSAVVSLLVVLVGTIVFSLSPVITLGSKIIVKIPVLVAIEKLWTVFRATGRFVWIIVYIVIVLAIKYVCEYLEHYDKGKWMQFGFVAFVVFQVFDLHGKFTEINYNYRNMNYGESWMSDDEFWNQIADNQEIKHINLADSLRSSEVYVLAQWCLDNDKTLNRYHFARKNSEIVDRNLRESLKNPNTSELYLFFDKQVLTLKNYELNYYQGDRFIVGYKGTLNLPTANVSIRELHMDMANDDGLIEGEYDINGRLLHKEGISHGPGWTLDPSEYEISITGSNLEKAEIYLRSDDDEKSYEYEVIKDDSSERVITTILDVKAEDFEIYVYNPSDDVVRINDIMLVEK